MGAKVVSTDAICLVPNKEGMIFFRYIPFFFFFFSGGGGVGEGKLEKSQDHAGNSTTKKSINDLSSTRC